MYWSSDVCSSDLRPAHDVIAREQGTGFGQREGEMVRGVARRRHRDQLPARAFDAIAIGEHAIGRVIAIDRGVRARAENLKRKRAIGRESGRERAGQYVDLTCSSV